MLATIAMVKSYSRLKMKCISMLILVLLLNRAIQYARCHTIYIIPTPDSPCPGAIIGQPCFTLEQYAADNSNYSANITLQLYPGNHSMDRVPLSILNINSFTMRATKPASVTVICGQLPPDKYSWFVITGEQLETVHISDITFNGCKIELDAGLAMVNVAFVRSSFVNNTCYNNNGGCGVLDIDTTDSGTALLVTVKECIFSDNILGNNGVIFNQGSQGNNLTVDQSIFKNNFLPDYDGGAAISSGGGNLNILNSNFSNNEVANNLNGGAIYVYGDLNSIILISNCHFNGNVASGFGGAIFVSHEPFILLSISNSSFINNMVISSSGLGGAIFARRINITNSIFIDNRAGSTNGYGGAVYVPYGMEANVSGCYFSNNKAGGSGGAIAINETNNILVSNTTFTNNTASSGGGGAIYTAGSESYNGTLLVSISLLNNTFSNNTSAYCGVLNVDEPYHSSAKIVGNMFTYNRAVGQAAGNNGGGVICVRNASVSVLENQFSHNMAAGDAGVLLVDDESDITISKCTFNNNTAGSNGGVLYTYFYPTHYTITSSSFTNNQAGGDGGVMFVGRASSKVKVTNSIFSYNSATGRGGAIAIAGSTLHINGASLCEKNTAKLGRVISACMSKVVITNPTIPSAPDPIYSFCTLYECSNSTYTFSKP